MAIRDILWACPLCHTTAGLQPYRRRERCRRCGADFFRGPRATVTAQSDGTTITRSVTEWLSALGEPQIPDAPPNGIVLGPEPVVMRVASREVAMRFGGELLGYREVFDRARPASLVLSTEMIRTDGPGSAEGLAWPLETITVVQPSSSSLQVAAGKMVASIKFPQTSLRLWSRALTTCLRRLHARRGFEIVEFQPLIRVRALPVRHTRDRASLP